MSMRRANKREQSWRCSTFVPCKTNFSGKALCNKRVKWVDKTSVKNRYVATCDQHKPK